ncbi:MAG TPA: hypothetical protein VHY56_12115 [Candidatus Binataceae bacterium]|jgi:hypothetical protein|nr:hypothetical protein [Candidatus Binataceae bacterium]
MKTYLRIWNSEGRKRRYKTFGVLFFAGLVGFAFGSAALAADSQAGDAKQAVSTKPANPPAQKVFPNFSVSMDSAIEVGGVYAAYVTVTNTASNADPLGTMRVVLQWPQAITFKGQRVSRLDVPAAMQMAGGGDKLLAALGTRNSELKRPLSNRIAGDLLAAPILPILAPGLLVAGPAALIYRSTQGPEYRERLKLDAKEFQLSPTRLDPFGTRLLTFAEPPIDGLLPQWSEQGYVFFRLGDYTLLQVTGQEFYNSDTTGGAFETVTCPWL